jgi:hypothetical protein
MGADQVGYLVKGPRRIAAGRIKAAVRACLRLRKQLLAAADDPEDENSRRDAALHLTGEFFDPADIPENPEREIRAFVDWWRRPEGRDVCCRDDPDNPRQTLVYAGEMSWGDEPSGYGYQMLKKALAWGFAEALGIR